MVLPVASLRTVLRQNAECGDTVASWLVCSTPDQTAWIQTLLVWELCVFFLGKTLDSHRASLCPGVFTGMRTVNLMLGVTL